MRFTRLRTEERTLLHQGDIEQWLAHNGFDWLLACEFDDADIEIKRNTLFWREGVWYWGDWHYGVFDGGEWRSGTWRGGVWRNGTWKGGTWLNGIIVKK